MSLVPRRLRLLWSDRDAAASDADQTVAEADQTGADVDQSLSDRDQAAAVADQMTSDREQEIADRLFDSVEPSERREHLRDYERAHAERDEGALSRVATSVARNLVSVERDEQAGRRDELARDRDLIAIERDEVADMADREAEALSRQAGDLGSAAKTAMDAATNARALAAAARRKAAADRERAARDREAAARDREYLCGEMERAQLDEVTGAYRRGLGEILLRHEMARATRVDGPLTLAFIDADGLKKVNADQGHAAGDTLLRNLHGALQARLRPYDPIVRWGGDEFVCAVAGASLDEAQTRIEQAQGDLAQLDPEVHFTFGLATLEPGDTIGNLVDRADSAQREAKQKKGI